MTACQSVSSSGWADAAVILTALGALVFVASYAWTTRGAWRDSIMGWHVMTFMVAILAVSALAVVAIIWGTDWPHRNTIRTAAWGVIAACIWWRVILLYRVQHRPAKHERRT
jgi:hypothetical protein